MDGPQKRQTHFSSRQVDSRTRNNKTSSLVDHPFFGLPNPEILKTEPTTRERERYHGGSEGFFLCVTRIREKRSVVYVVQKRCDKTRTKAKEISEAGNRN